MSRKIIDDPLSMDPNELLRMIESDPDSFTEGRRNNDMVNWFLAKRLVELCGFGDQHPSTSLRLCGMYETDFAHLIEKMNARQKQSLTYWDVTPLFKLHRLYQGYGTINAFGLKYIWLPMDYEGLVHEDQLQMLASTTAPGKD